MFDDVFEMGQGEARDQDWLDAVWVRLPERSREIVERRAAGETLDSIGGSLGLSRERVRQIQQQAIKVLVAAQQTSVPLLVDDLSAIIGDQAAVDHADVAVAIPAASGAAQAVLIAALGVKRPMLPSGPLPAHWTLRPTALDHQLKELVALMPLGDEDLRAAAGQVGLPETVAWDELLAADYRSARTDLGWVRTGRTTRDRAYLWLKQQGMPRPAAEIAEVAGSSEHATRESMRRDEAFAQVRPEGTWALSDWHVDGANNRYASAEEVVVEVLRDLGPLDEERLRVECQRRYPVTGWRITQCLSSNVIGLNSEGRYDLTERGAIPVEDAEPRRPNHIQVSGNVIGVEVPVTYDVVRGSGIPVNRWLTWYLGLRTAPSARYFKTQDGSGELTVRRATSNAQISSLRSAALDLGVVEGCKLVLILRLDSNSASLRHACAADACPALSL